MVRHTPEVVRLCFYAYNDRSYLFRKAKARAAERGESLKTLLTRLWRQKSVRLATPQRGGA